MVLKLNKRLAMVCRTGSYLVLICVLPGCVKLTSSASLTSAASLVSSSVSSDLIASPFRSSSRSSAQEQEPERENKEIQEEIEIYTAYWLREDNPDSQSLLVRVAQLLARRGVSDWQVRDAVWRGMGRALALSDWSTDSAADYVRNWSAGTPEFLSILLKAYCSARTMQPLQHASARTNNHDSDPAENNDNLPLSGAYAAQSCAISTYDDSSPLIASEGEW